jgi:hypothetical protein
MESVVVCSRRLELAATPILNRRIERAKGGRVIGFRSGVRHIFVLVFVGITALSLAVRGQEPSSESERLAQSAEKLGLDQDAFAAYVRAYQNLPQPAPPASEQRLRERIITVAERLGAKPPIPAAATAHFTKAASLIDADTLLGGVGTESMVTAAAELVSAIRLAPWWPEATFKLATVLQKLQRFDEAVVNLNLYRLADPNGYAAAIAAKTGVPPASREMPAAKTAPATVYIYWPKQVRGDGRPKVMCDGFHVADIRNRHFIVLNVTPGMHSIGVHDKALPMTFESGQKYYLRANVSGFPARMDVQQAGTAEGETELRDDDMKANDPRRTYSIGCNAGAGTQRRR